MQLPEDARILFSLNATEQRAQSSLWQQIFSQSPQRCIAVERQEPEAVYLKAFGEPSRRVSLRDEVSIAAIVDCSCLYIDISGLGHQIWAPLLRAAKLRVDTLRIIYVEPSEYKTHSSPASPTLFDLSSGFHGVSPLPGFAQLSGPEDEAKTILVALLGFEGSRPLHISQQLDPPPKVIPVIGVPGFQITFPAFAIACNRAFLTEQRAYSELRYARASCPFEARDVLRTLRVDYPDHYMYIATVGTKPHALGAVLFAIDNPSTTEIMYDHPIRKPGRTSGVGLVHVYSVVGD